MFEKLVREAWSDHLVILRDLKLRDFETVKTKNEKEMSQNPRK